ncbi:MAG: proprotein convertase P-domain-containing protein [Chiayiivirga sp.]|jgi:lysyl endopeptidase|uniref:proprotein convertase P-domain-containing protein n=1 Tax=Chiayiivirga sp. TaxID=2041042 RepID=UPI0025BEE281|nr:proprotein convertase P-domain-containing protein [Chiayiivirga sp.]MCI1710437.1 proprotein convertase P-domain-containing protein [Chiayiivirga sp.]MCI1730833.1 proprotein convertase P-domain-containing protein [Chiayiivirga sp.]
MHFATRSLAALIALGLGSTLAAKPVESGTISLRDALILSQPDLAQLQLEDSKKLGGAYRYGIQVPVEGVRVSAESAGGGKWETLKDGRLVWRRTIASPGARSLDLHFAKLQLPTGAELRLVGEGSDNLRLIRAEDLSGNGAFHSPYVLGDSLRMELIVPVAKRGSVVLELAQVTHGYRGLFERDAFEKSGSCNVDVACPAGSGWDDQIDAVGHYTFTQGSSSYVCTGTLVGNTANNATPYFLTANHCVSTQTVASSIVVYWNYQSATCRTPGSGSSGTPLNRNIATHSQSGTTLVSTNAASDFALLRLNANVPAGADAFYSGWDASGSTPTSAAGIHHPAGHEKRIAIDNDALQVSGYGGATGSTHWRIVDWNEGTTEGGSSGSGLWNQNKRLVGQLHGGSAACGNELSDYYGRLSVSWAGGGTSATRLSDHLNPGGGVTSFAGYRTPGGGGNVAPTANYSFSVSGLTATFTDSSSDSDGSIASRSWNFGDGTTSTATNPSKTYAAGGTYNVVLNVTDNGGLSNSTTKAVTVTSSGGGGTVLSNGVAVTGLSATTGNSLNYTMVVPAGATGLKFVTSGGTGDMDMYVKFGSAPTDTAYDCRPYASGNAETCNIATAQAGTYHVRLKAYSSFTGVSLTGSYSTGGGGGGSQTYSNGTDINIPDNNTTGVYSDIAVSGRSGNGAASTPVAVNIVHPYKGDLIVDLVAPDGSVYNLHNRTGGSADNINQTYNVNLSGEALNGTWRLRARDRGAADVGYINSWSITF